MNPFAMAVLRIQILGLLLLLPTMVHSMFSPRKDSPIMTAVSSPARRLTLGLTKDTRRRRADERAAFLLSTARSSSARRPRRSRDITKRTARASSSERTGGPFHPFRLNINNGDESSPSSPVALRRTPMMATATPSSSSPYRHHHHGHHAGGVCGSYVPPYGNVFRSSPIVLNMMSPAGTGGIGDSGGPDDRFRKKMNQSRSIKDPVVQDFGDARDWQASKTGVGRMGDDKAGDDGVSEMSFDFRDDVEDGGGFLGRMDGPPATMRRQRRPAPPPPPIRNGGEMMFEGDGGNYWVNPPRSMDRYPGRGVEDEGMMTRRRRSGSRNRRTRARDPDGDDDKEEWWETRRANADEYDDYDYEDDMIDERDDVQFEQQRRRYGPPPGGRSRSSFRSGAPPPPRPVKSFYDKLFWFGFDPDVTGPADRTMFGGTRGKFNAMDMLRDREERQRMRAMRGGAGGGGGGLSRRRRAREDSVIQDFGDVRDWNARKAGRGRAGGEAVGDDRDRPDYGYESALPDGGAMGGGVGGGGPAPFPVDAGPPPPMPPPPGVPPMPGPDFEEGYGGGGDFYLDDNDAMGGPDLAGRGGRRTDRSERRRRRNASRGRSMDRRAMEYDRFLSGGGGGGGEEELYPPGPPPSSRRRRGYAYRYDDDLLDYDDGEFIDVEPRADARAAGAADPVGNLLDAASMETNRPDIVRPSPGNGGAGAGRRRSWQERAEEMDRVPPRGAVAWGPEGRIASGENPLDRAATEALADIRRAKRYAERKERAVEDAKEEVAALKADASLWENQLEDVGGGRELKKLQRELGIVLRDIEDASRELRVARAEADDAADQVRALEERNWALLSEYEAGRSFEGDMTE